MHERRESFVDSDWTILGVTCVGGILFYFILNKCYCYVYFIFYRDSQIIITVYFVFRTYIFGFGFIKRSIVFFEH